MYTVNALRFTTEPKKRQAQVHCMKYKSESEVGRGGGGRVPTTSNYRTIAMLAKGRKNGRSRN